MRHQSEFFKQKPCQGTILIITLFFIVLMTLEVTMISFVMQRSVGEKAIAGTAYQSARGGTQVAVQRLKDALNIYIKDNGTDNVMTDFAKGGANDIDNENLLTYNAENSADEDTGVDISAWVEERRGIWYHIMARAKYGDTDLLSHEWVKITTGLCTGVGSGGADSPGLITILDGGEEPGYAPGVSPVDGRVVFGDADDIYTWHYSTGLSTIGSSADSWCGVIAVTDSGDFYVACGDGTLAFWNENDGTTFIDWGYEHVPGYNGEWSRAGHHKHGIPFNFGLADDGRVAWMGRKGSSRLAMTWHPSTGLSTMRYMGTSGDPSEFRIAVAPNGRAMFCNDGGSGANDDIYTWHASTGLSSIGPHTWCTPKGSIQVSDNNRFFYAPWTDPGRVYSWLGGFVTTVISGGGGGNGSHFGQDYRLRVDKPRDRVYTGYNHQWSNVHTWAPSTGHTEFPDVHHWEPLDMAIGSGGRVFWSAYSDIVSWKEGTAGAYIQNIDPFYDKYGGILAVNERGYYWDWSGPGSLKTWDEVTGVSTVIVGEAYGLEDSFAFDETTERLYLGINDTNAAFITYHPDTGISTILTGEDGPGAFFSIDTFSDGRVYFGDYNDPGHFWTWKDPEGPAGPGSTINTPCTY